MTTSRQVEANRRNADKSTGPKSPEGKAAARGNALKHGLSGAGVALPAGEWQTVAQRMEQWRGGYVLETVEDHWLYEQMIVSTVEVDRCQAEERAVRGKLACRAAVCWDDDRRARAEVLGSGLSRRPSLVALKLKSTKQGCAWLLERWRILGSVLESGGEWTEEQRALTLDLTGIPRELRTSLGAPEPGDDPALVAMVVERLEQRCTEVLEGLDELERTAAEQGHPLETAREVALLRRYEAAWMRRYLWAHKQLSIKERRGGWEPPLPAPAPAPVPLREPEPLIEAIEPVIEALAPVVEAPRAAATVSVSVGVSRPATAGSARVAAVTAPRTSYMTGTGGRLSDLLDPELESLNRRARRAAECLARGR
jgi:hypothetical protein